MIHRVAMALRQIYECCILFTDLLNTLFVGGEEWPLLVDNTIYGSGIISKARGGDNVYSNFPL